jgi:hypothetical protein
MGRVRATPFRIWRSDLRRRDFPSRRPGISPLAPCTPARDPAPNLAWHVRRQGVNRRMAFSFQSCSFQSCSFQSCQTIFYGYIIDRIGFIGGSFTMDGMRRRTKTRTAYRSSSQRVEPGSTRYSGDKKISLPAFRLHWQGNLYKYGIDPTLGASLLFRWRHRTVGCGAGPEGVIAMRECREPR